MNIAINRERVAATFTELCEISSPSKKEAGVATYLKKQFTDLGADLIHEDDSAAQTGADCGNLIIRFDGNNPELEGLFFSCHMDTVEPGEGVEVVRTEDIFTSKGNTILGSDDKSGLRLRGALTNRSCYTSLLYSSSCSRNRPISSE